MERISIFELYGETVEVFQHGEDDYEVYYHDSDFSVRGTEKEIYANIEDRSHGYEDPYESGDFWNTRL